MMSLKRLLPWLLLLCLLMCSLLMVHAPFAPCPEMVSCGWSHIVSRVLVALFGVLGLASLGAGLWAAALQLHHTHSMLRRLRAIPKHKLPLELLPLARAVQLHKRLDVLEDAGVDAFCYGLLRPRVAVTTGLLHMLTPREVEAVLRHERHHLARRDPLRALLWTAWDHACWWDASRGTAARLRHELAADRAVIAAGQRRVLARALLKLLTHAPSRGNAGLAISGVSVTAARIEQLLRPERRVVLADPSFHMWRNIAVAVAVALLLCGVVL